MALRRGQARGRRRAADVGCGNDGDLVFVLSTSLSELGLADRAVLAVLAVLQQLPPPLIHAPTPLIRGSPRRTRHQRWTPTPPPTDPAPATRPARPRRLALPHTVAAAQSRTSALALSSRRPTATRRLPSTLRSPSPLPLCPTSTHLRLRPHPSRPHKAPLTSTQTASLPAHVRDKESTFSPSPQLHSPIVAT